MAVYPILNDVAGYSNLLKDIQGNRQFRKLEPNHNRLRSISLSGEAASADQREYEIWLNHFKERIKKEKLTPDQIWNADESRIFYKLSPSKTITQKGHFLKGWKKPKCNMYEWSNA